MAQFKDAADRQWTIRVDINAVRRVRDECGLDLLNIESVTEMGENPLLLFDCLVAIIKPQLDTHGITGVMLGESFYGDVAEAAADALVDGIIDSYPEKKRKLARKAFEKQRAMNQRVMEVVEAKFDLSMEKAEKNAMVELDQKMNELMSGDSSSSAQELPVSILGH